MISRPLYRFLYLGLLTCVVATTALGMQPKWLVSVPGEQETETDSPTEESGEEEIESTSGLPICRRNTVPAAAIKDFGGTTLRVPQSSPKTREPVISPRRRYAEHNGFGGNMRL
jgi:hypothetical protein